MKLGYVIVNYNNTGYSLDCIKTIFQSNRNTDRRIVVVDNNSVESERLSLADGLKNYPIVQVFFSPVNLGYFQALNLGVSQIQVAGFSPDFICIGNNDLSFPEDFEQLLFQRREFLSGEYVISPRILTLDGVDQNPHVSSSNDVTSLREFLWDLYNFSFVAARILLFFKTIVCVVRRRFYFFDKATPRDLTSPSSGHIYQGYGAVYILTKKFVDVFGALYAPSFLMGEEYFISYQLAMIDRSVYYYKELLVRHQDHASTSKAPKKLMWLYSSIAHRLYKLHGRTHFIGD